MGFLDKIKQGMGLGGHDDAAEAQPQQTDAPREDPGARADEAAAQAAPPAAAPAPGGPPPAPAAPHPAPAPAAPHPAPAKPAAPAAHKAQRTYTVKEGDTLSQIGDHFGVPYTKIAEANHIENPDLIYPGQTFVIPD